MSEKFAVVTLPDGTVINLPILTPSGGGPDCIDVRTLQSKGYCTYDPGFTSTASCSSAISYIDGPKGVLLHRGYRIEELAKHCSYLEVCYLLLNGDLPSQHQLQIFDRAIKSHMMLHEKVLHIAYLPMCCLFMPHTCLSPSSPFLSSYYPLQLRTFFSGFKDDSHPMAIMVGVVGSLSAFYGPNEDHAVTTLRVIAKLPTIAAMAYKHSIGQPYVYPRAELSFAENFLNMMFSTPFEPYRPPQAFVKAMDLIFLLHADHEQNASTSTVRIAGSSDANPLACISAGIASLWGPMHGGANEAAVKMLRDIGSVEAVPGFLAKVKSKECKLMGFGHRVYKNVDPRAIQMKVLTHEVLGALGASCDPSLRPLLQVAIALEEAALADEYFVKRKLFPNVDFYSGLTLTAMGIPTSMFTVLFAIGRSAGWIAQWKESVEETGRRISRPRQMYVGEPERPFVKIPDRLDEEGHFTKNALTRRRSASACKGIAYSQVGVGGSTSDLIDVWGY